VARGPDAEGAALTLVVVDHMGQIQSARASVFSATSRAEHSLFWTLKSSQPTPPNPTPLYSRAAQFYVLKDNAALSNADITTPRQSTDQARTPDVNFGFNSAGARKFQSVTAAIARRGQDVSTLGQSFNQHFAVALDNKLITVPSIDFKIYPDGVRGGGGAEIAGVSPSGQLGLLRRCCATGHYRSIWRRANPREHAKPRPPMSAIRHRRNDHVLGRERNPRRRWAPRWPSTGERARRRSRGLQRCRRPPRRIVDGHDCGAR
jgi:hypothetical protein